MKTKTLPLVKMSIDDLYNGNKATYEVPIYQRNYAWEKDEIAALVQDVYDAYLANKQAYYIGTLVSFHEFEVIDREAGRNAFVLTPKRWIETVNAIGMTSKQGRYAATYANKDIAFKFASWISAEFELYVIKDYQRLKSDEQQQQKLEWNLQRTLSKINYRIHTDAIKEQIIPKEVTRSQAAFVYASEADLLNVALFGMTAAEYNQFTKRRRLHI